MFLYAKCRISCFLGTGNRTVLFTNRAVLFTNGTFFLNHWHFDYFFLFCCFFTNDYFNKLPHVYFRFSSYFSVWEGRVIFKKKVSPKTIVYSINNNALSVIAHISKFLIFLHFPFISILESVLFPVVLAINNKMYFNHKTWGGGGRGGWVIYWGGARAEFLVNFFDVWQMSTLWGAVTL